MYFEFPQAVPGLPLLSVAIRVPVKMDGVLVPCDISQEALRDHFGADDSVASLQKAFDENRATIESLAAEMLTASHGDAVLMRTADFDRVRSRHRAPPRSQNIRALPV